MAESSVPVPSFRRDRVADGVTSYLRDMILTGQLPAGEHLKVEHLAERLNISVTPIRESLLELHAEGYVDRIAHRGYVVVELTRDGFRDEVLVLAMITGELAARAADHVSPEDMTHLAKLRREIQAADKRDDRATADDLNHRFHGAINKMARSPKLAWLAQRHSHYVPRSALELLDGHPSVCTHDHRAVLAALRSGDRDAARSAMTEHLVSSGEVLADVLGSSGILS